MGLSCWLRLFRPFVLRRRVYPAEYCCGGYAAGALLGRLCRLGLSRVRDPSSFVGAFILPGVAAAAVPPMRFGLGCAFEIWTRYELF